MSTAQHSWMLCTTQILSSCWCCTTLLCSSLFRCAGQFLYYHSHCSNLFLFCDCNRYLLWNTDQLLLFALDHWLLYHGSGGLREDVCPQDLQC